jgi:hypothetical protein
MVCHVGKKEEGHVARGGFPSSSWWLNFDFN